MATPTRRGVLTAALVGAMTASSFQIFVLAVLAPEIIVQFGLSRTELGLLGSANTLVGALTAPLSGRLTDAMGPRRAVVVAIAISAVGMGVMAVAPNVAVLAVSAALLGVPQGWGNPATNALIAERVPPGRRGTVTGVKQSGVQFGIFLSGLTLPSLTLLLGWRGAVGGYALLFAALAVGVLVGLGPAPSLPVPPVGASPVVSPAGASPVVTSAAAASDEGAVAGWIRRLALYALVAGMVGGAVGRFFPLWAQEVVGLSSRTAGLLVALGGLVGMGARVVAGRLAESRIEPARLLSMLALVGATYCGALALAASVGAWLLWPSTVLNAIGIAAWNAVAMLAVITAVPAERAGRASGIVILGFLSGLSIGSPLAGLVVDRFGSYQPVWLGGLVGLLVAAALVARRPSRRAFGAA